MSNNNNRNLLTKQQQLELLTSVPHFRMTDYVISAIQSNHSYYKIKSIILKCAPLSLQEKDWYYFWKAMLIYELPVELVKKLMQNNISMSAIHTICEALNDECISLKDLEILADYLFIKQVFLL